MTNTLKQTKENKITSVLKKHFIEIVLSITLLLAFISENNVFFGIIILFFGIISLRDISKGLIIFIIIMPFSSFLNENIQFLGLNSTFIMTMVLLFAFFYQNFKKEIKLDKKSLTVLMLILFTNIISLAINLSHLSFILSYYGTLVAAVMYTLIYINSPKKKDLIASTLTAIIITTINVIILILYQNDWNIFASESRLEVEGLLLIKAVAYYIASATLITFYKFYQIRKETKFLSIIIYLALILQYFLILNTKRVFLFTMIGILIMIISDLIFNNKYLAVLVIIFCIFTIIIISTNY